MDWAEAEYEENDTIFVLVVVLEMEQYRGNSRNSGHVLEEEQKTAVGDLLEVCPVGAGQWILFTHAPRSRTHTRAAPRHCYRTVQCTCTRTWQWQPH